MQKTFGMNHIKPFSGVVGMNTSKTAVEIYSKYIINILLHVLAAEERETSEDNSI